MFPIFFLTTVAKFVEKLLPPQKCISCYPYYFPIVLYSTVVSDTLQVAIHPISKEFKELYHLTLFNSTGVDDIPSRFVKDVDTVLIKPITYVVNLFITSSMVSSRSSKISTGQTII